MTEVSSEIFAANLAALAVNHPDLAQELPSVSPRPLQWLTTPTGLWSATREHEGKTLQWASRYDPVAEARKLIAPFDPARHGAVIFLGLGLGYQVEELFRSATNKTIVLVYEPDISLLRAVLEKIDCRSWLLRPGLLILTGSPQRAQLIRRLEPVQALLTQGLALLYHPPTRQLYSQQINAFCSTLKEVLEYFRVHVATAMVNAQRTVHNLLMALPYYAGADSTDPLLQAAAGYPAVCVAAGPSLARNVHLLADPAFRSRIVVIAVQTALKPLLARGIYPDFVTALDYHPISQRFYEGLPPLDRVTLVAEPKVHPSVLDLFPGPRRILPNAFLNRLLASDQDHRYFLPAGTTVAHLSLYLAQHLGCDPIIFIGQDLAFSDGLYYCPGTAIHEVWAPELGLFNTLEMMEWQRIVRHKNHLKKLQDIHGRPVYTDQQMAAYLQQFERDFAAARQTIIDATEGGLPKAGAQIMTLAEALKTFATRPVPPLPAPSRHLDTQRLRQALTMLRRRRSQIARLDRLTDQTIGLVQRFLVHQRDYPKAKAIYQRIDANRRRVETDLQDAFALVNHINTIATFNRIRMDRAISASDTDAFERQRKVLDRDLVNLRWIAQACQEMLKLFDQAQQRLEEFLNRTASSPSSGTGPLSVPAGVSGAQGV